MRALAPLFVGLLAASCASTPPPSPPSSHAGEPLQPSAWLAAQATRTATVPAGSRPTKTVEPTAPSVASPVNEAHAALGADSFVYVVTDNLRVRSKPEVSDESVKYEPLLWRGALAWVSEGPIRGSAYDWYLIHPLGEADLQHHPDPPPAGWVAEASKDGVPWIAEWGVPCPPTPLGTVSDFDYPPQGMIGLSCFGERTIEFVAMASRWNVDCGTGSSLLEIEPTWLRPCGDHIVLDVESGFAENERAPLFVTLAPDADVDVSPMIESRKWVRVRVKGQYDDPRAQDCHVSSRPRDEPTVRICRSQFVVASLASQP